MALDRQKLARPFTKLRKQLRKFPREPEPERVHKLRTRLRRVETALETLAPDCDCERKQVLKALARIRKRAGKARDLDVLTAYLTGLKVPDSEQDCRILLIEHLGAERDRKAGKLGKVIGQEAPRLRRHLGHCMQEVGKTAGSRAVPDALSEAMEISRQLAAPRRLGPGNLHEYRLAIKRLLHVLQMADEAKQDRRLIGELKRAKDAIGEWHDWQVLQGIAEEVVAHRGCRLRSRLRAQLDRKYRQALRIADSVKARYFKTARKPGVLKPGSPVARATLAIAA